MIRHQVFFEMLSRLDEEDPSWRSQVAGLAMPRRIDSKLDTCFATAKSAWRVVALLTPTIVSLVTYSSLMAAQMQATADAS